VFIVYTSISIIRYCSDGYICCWFCLFYKLFCLLVSDMDLAADDVKQRVENYIEHTRLEEQFKELCTELLAADELPYNPYPWLVNKFQVIAQR